VSTQIRAQSGSQPKIDIRHLAKSFPQSDGRSLAVIEDLNLQVAAGEFVSLLGPSGCGKSTALNMIGNIDPPTKGEIFVNGQALKLGSKAVRIGFVFQSPRLIPWKSIEKNVRFGLESDGTIPRDEWTDRVQAALELVGVADFRKAFPSQLSGGMQTRVAIARALAMDPEIILMDEPFSSLDEITGRRMRGELTAIWERLHPTIVFITHDMLEAVFLSQRVVLLTPRPMRVYTTFAIDAPRPRSYTDETLFRMQTEVLESFEGMIERAEANMTPARLS
jgi:ABC-type nitrate/sulfonate/bicarbonate transport system ATPase subunit